MRLYLSVLCHRDVLLVNQAIVIIITCTSFSIRTTVNLPLPTPVCVIFFSLLCLPSCALLNERKWDYIQKRQFDLKSKGYVHVNNSLLIYLPTYINICFGSICKRHMAKSFKNKKKVLLFFTFILVIKLTESVCFICFDTWFLWVLTAPNWTMSYDFIEFLFLLHPYSLA